MLALLLVVLGFVGLVAVAVVFVRSVVDIRARDRAVVARHLQTMQAREGRCSPASPSCAERR